MRLLKSLLVFAGFVAAVYIGLIRYRGWHARHYAPRARRTHFAVCLATGAVFGLGTVVVLRDQIACPAGHGSPDLQSTKTTSGKSGVKLVCFDAAGHPQDGSVFAGLFALLGAAVIGFAGSSAIWRSFGPPAPLAPAGPAPGAVDFGAPTDRRERRKERKRAEHRDRRR